MSIRPLIVAFLKATMLLSVFVNIALAAGPGKEGKAVPFDADVIKIRELFEARRFSELNAVLAKYQTLCEKDVRWEVALQNGFHVFAVSDPSFTAGLEDWIQSTPGSWVPRLARAVHYGILAQKARGYAWAKDTSAEQFRREGEKLSVAARDVDAVLKANPRFLFPYYLRIRMNKTGQLTNVDDRLVEKALQIYPGSYLLRFQHMLALLPRWGGSYEEMEQFARESAPYAKQNPAIKTLSGFVYWDLADLADNNGDSRKAIPLYEKALESGENWTFLSDLADACFRYGMYDKALRTIDRAIALRPTNASGHITRSKILIKQQKWDEALAEVEEATRLGGLDSEKAAEVRNQIVHRR